MITEERWLWGSNIYIDVFKEMPNVKMGTISGTFLTKVFKGPYKNMGKWAQTMNNYVECRDKITKKLYF
jgi:hypothetical protein